MGARDAPASIQFFSISCSLGKNAKKIGWYPYLYLGNPGSATERSYANACSSLYFLIKSSSQSKIFKLPQVDFNRVFRFARTFQVTLSSFKN